MHMKKQYINPLTTAMAMVSATILSGSGVSQINTGGQGDGIGGDAPARRNTLIAGPVF